MNALRSALFAVFFYPGTVVAVLAGMIASALHQEALVDATHRWARYHRWCARVLLGVKSQVEGRLPTGAVLVAAKHQSMFETIDFLLLLDRPAVVLKRELADMPGWGRIAREYGVIPVDREGGAAALRRMLKAAQAAVAAGRPILIFPEGTRVPVGERPELQPGFAGLYKSLGIPVVPVALDSGRLWPRHSFAKKPGVVTIQVGDAIPPGLPRKEMEARVHAAINALEP
ncbi:MAG: Acyl-CoA:1-acyl-sn-glycerol-3-phosphate acyltransferase [uncultured Sphingosinicella sp.]|uniref:Acyl-CoA:1-acyl-sn-glycerol-3-phosphate acyltransferase n=1 Tax=uncultured Sphingosinicella sp. TaxID=478748 RepID=A0A6J4U9G7_9SPHN|nr:lysophospholipid acyltransferase family protein [uncultured Sphingosinicella sp.]CAA9543957.1 MAG: Acyl-CoA:1-acyl-sn-glycerol-3-phosphate acyltransferase [uncultured Sphingosinicella sp.]